MFAARFARSAIPRAGFARSYAVAAAASNSVKPPVQLFGIDGTYASALYTASAKTNALDTVDKNLQQLKATLEKDLKLNQIIASPTLDPQAKNAIVTELQKLIGADKNIENFLQILAENNRLGLLKSVIDKFEVLMKAHKGEVEAIVTSAQPLDSRTLSRLESAISKSAFIGQGQKLRVSNKVDTEIVGGLVVEIGDRTIDLSVSSKMAKLNKLLTDAL
ncbi:F1 complex, OSCP/delta subunit of ATPase [Terfezia boudieri ATCC MYA-4762]|uniref:ATP synthase subunit 5, mitochondrial n=1 Tax=Terfezia boudieri ATCC MYA-4762 TaxID=1051890 RepID=A0A3N4M250_9PEZI|nr:F1 complex, OSCP/delta subunit of ATPase [Terfezia boudieri ATCC MYA-4762]